ncbi:hypothetical protein FACS189449_05700 [Alphaproteobacteria bacterium]|nr:hypothetical protein FACS189449_05700 [Alphaproteobacteria bacterium]
MQNASYQPKEGGGHALDFIGMFDAFCLEIFSNRDKIEDKKDEFDFRQMHKSLCNIIKTSLEHDKNLSFHKDIREIVYMMAALADEIFLNMEWIGKKFWEENMLEQTFFGTQIAGEAVFNRIEDLVIAKHTLFLEKAEIYIKVLLLGFKGKFRGMDEEQKHINVYRRKLFDSIARHDISIANLGGRLFQKEYTYTIPTIHRKLLPDASIITYISSFFVFMFLVISTVVWIFETLDLQRILHEISIIAIGD